MDSTWLLRASKNVENSDVDEYGNEKAISPLTWRICVDAGIWLVTNSV